MDKIVRFQEYTEIRYSIPLCKCGKVKSECDCDVEKDKVAPIIPDGESELICQENEDVKYKDWLPHLDSSQIYARKGI